jgi:hypothetical protein
VQDLNENTQELDLDAAMARTRTRYDELVRARNVRRRWISGAALAVLVVAAAVIVPRLGSGNGQRVNVAVDGGAAGATTTTALAMPGAPAGFRLSKDGDVWVLTRIDDGTATTVPVTGAVGVGEAATAIRPAPVQSVAAGTVSDSVVLGFGGCGNAIEWVRYRYADGRLTVDAAVEPRFCPASPPSPSQVTVELPLPAAWGPSSTVEAAAV